MRYGYALIIDDTLQDLDGAVVELSVSEPGIVRADIRIPAHQPQDDG